jgi:hypothetical protein
MGSFLKNLKSLFIVEEEPAKQKKQEAKSVAPESTPVESAVSIDRSTVEGSGSVNRKFLDILLKSLEDSNQKGFDYLEYKQSLQSLRKMNMDEETRFKSAFAMAQTMGATPQTLSKSGEVYLQILKSEEEKFKQSMINQRKLKVDEKQASLENMDKWIANKEAEIEKIKLQIEKKIASKSKMEQEVAKANKKIQTVSNNFMATYDHLVVQINEDLEKIKRYLK